MNRFRATTATWRGGAIAGALLLAVALAGPAAAVNTNLTATAQYSASSEWQSEMGNTSFIAAKAFDGDLTTRWNVHADDQAPGSWIAANWEAPVTINKVVVHEFLDRVGGFRVQRRDAGSDPADEASWQDVYVAEGDGWSAVKGGIPQNAVFTMKFPQAFQTAGLRILITEIITSAPTLWEVEAWNNPQGTVIGTVTDPTGKPLAGAIVRAGSDRATTNAEGRYTLTADAGRYNIVAGLPGAFRDRTARGVDLAANATITRDFVLTPLPPNLSLTATPVSSSDWQGGTDYDAAKANDGNLTTRWNSEAGDIFGATLEMQWPQDQTFNKITIREAIGRITNYTINRYDEATSAYVPIAGLEDVAAPTGTGDRTYSHLLSTPVTSRRLQLVINDAIEVPTIYELEVANAPVGTVSGVVRDLTSGNAVANAAVASADSPNLVLATANAQGQFSLIAEPDDYLYVATAPNYFAGTPVPVTVNAGQTSDAVIAIPPTGPNLSLAAKASASTEDEFGENPASLVNDGDEETVWLAAEATNQWVALTWDKPTRITAVQFRNFEGVIGRSYLEMLDADGTTWVQVPNSVFNPESLAASHDPDVDLFFPDGFTTTGLRYFIVTTNSTTNIPGLGELIVFDSPIPKPQ